MNTSKWVAGKAHHPMNPISAIPRITPDRWETPAGFNRHLFHIEDHL